MITSINNGIIETKSYDVVAELEAHGDKYGVAKYIREQKKECEEQARKYLAEHPKTKYYYVGGFPMEIPWEDAPEEDSYSLIAYTDDEIQRMKELFVEVWNKLADDPKKHVQTFEEIPEEDFDLIEFEGENDELTKLLWDRGASIGFAVRSINITNPVHAYRFVIWGYNKRQQEMDKHRSGRLVVLTDEEYLYLLTEQLFSRHFSFNRLLLYNAPLAQKICHSTDGDFFMEAESPYLILMDEVVEDMENILGHDPVDDELCSYCENGHSYHAHMIVERDKMEIYWEDLPDDDFTMERMTSGRVKDIDAKAVLKIFKADDYEDMLDKIKERFNSHSAYDDLVAYLKENGIIKE